MMQGRSMGARKEPSQLSLASFLGKAQGAAELPFILGASQAGAPAGVLVIFTGNSGVVSSNHLVPEYAVFIALGFDQTRRHGRKPACARPPAF